VFEITDESKIKALFGFLKNENKELKKLIDSITPENLHKEIDWGGVSGEEEW
jgi:antitoxin component of MazEF toxin-antitoxin module